MSSLEAVPCSSMRTALLRYGNSRALTTKPARSDDLDGVLAARHGERQRRLDRVVAGRDRPHDLDQLHHRGRVEEVDAAHPVGALVAIASSTTGSVDVFVARIAVGLDDLLELGEQRPLDREVLDDALDDEVAVGEVAEVVGGRDAAEDGVALGRSSLPLATCLSRLAVSAATPPSAPARRRDRTTTSNPAGGDLGQSRAHDPRSDDAHRVMSPMAGQCSYPSVTR